MKHIYLDESGNLGFTEKSGEYFIVAGLCVNNEKEANKCIKNVKTELAKKYKQNELKFSNSADINRRRVLKCISRRDVSISCLILKKEWVPIEHRIKPPLIHRHMIGQLLHHTLKDRIDTRINIVIDKCINGNEIPGFNEYMNRKISTTMRIDHVSSDGNNGIQAVDFIAGAIHRKYRNDDDSFYEIIENKIDITVNSPEQIFKNSSY
jgi:hypothetical protein